VLPRVPARLGKAYYALATTHGAFGTVTELAGLYILLSAGTNVLPEKVRITNYKVWMRAVLAFWWVVAPTNPLKRKNIRNNEPHNRPPGLSVVSVSLVRFALLSS
jgi:hypothetical protein